MTTEILEKVEEVLDSSELPVKVLVWGSHLPSAAHGGADGSLVGCRQDQGSAGNTEHQLPPSASSHEEDQAAKRRGNPDGKNPDPGGSPNRMFSETHSRWENVSRTPRVLIHVHKS